MRILLDTNIIIHREASKLVRQDIGVLFNWLDKLHYEKCVHPLTVTELNKNINTATASTMQIKLANYNLLKTIAPIHHDVKTISDRIDIGDNDINDTQLLNEVFQGRVDILISEDKKIHTKAELLGIKDKVYKIDDFLERVTSENPALVDYNILAIKQKNLGNISLDDSFFDSFKEDYKGFSKWYNKKADEIAYVCYVEDNLAAFLYLKIEDEKENYSDIVPTFSRKRRLKIGTFKVISNGLKLGERFLKIIFENARQYDVQEIYVTIFEKRHDQTRLIELIEDWGFKLFGTKETESGIEKVYVRSFGKDLPVDLQHPRLTFPFVSWETEKYIIKIEPQWHTELFPDSINTREQTSSYISNEPYRNAISKVYISHDPQVKNLKSGDLLLIYRIGEPGTQKKYTSTLTTLCIVEGVITNLTDFGQLVEVCRKKTVISDKDLRTLFWDKFPRVRPSVIELLFAHSFPTPKVTVNDLIKMGIFKDIMSIPQGLIKLSREQFKLIVNFAYRNR